MRKIFYLLLVCFLFPFAAMAQKTVKIISSDRSEYHEEWGVERIYHPVFLHEGSTLSADSADYDDKAGFFDANGNVVITQPNGTIVYADKLHYIKASRIAILTNNVRMVDKQNVLTTNHLTYNLNTKIGTYTNGGRIVNTTDTLTSRNATYFENSQDAYFRYNVVVRTPRTKIFTDTLRYNSPRKMAYFYGPTNIKGNSDGNLYTENGNYHTETDLARFGKNNLYTEGSKFLKGDSLYYDGKAGIGRAVKNVEFIDTAEKIIMNGQLGLYREVDESITMTQNAYLTIITTSDSSSSPEAAQDSIATDSIGTPPDSLLTPQKTEIKTDSAFMSADTLYSKIILLKDYQSLNLNISRDGGEIEEDEGDSFGMGEEEDPADILPSSQDQVERPNLQDSLSLDTNQLTGDSSRTQHGLDSLSRPPEALDSTSIAKKIDSTVRAVDTTKKVLAPAIVKANKDTMPASLRADIGEHLKADSAMMLQSYIPKVGEADSSYIKAKEKALEQPAQKSDSTAIADTARTRIVMAYHNMRIFKSDLQARADSAFYGYPDSVIRCFGNPMIWSQGSQLSGDTIYMQLKNQQLDNMFLKTNAFIVSAEGDSTKFNQVKGRKISGFFTNNKLDVMYIDGNAQSNYYSVDQNKITGMMTSVSSRKKILFDNNEISDMIDIRKPEWVYYPVGLIPEDKEVLPGFIWKPENRPKSKEEVINGVAAPSQSPIPENIRSDQKDETPPKKKVEEQEEGNEENEAAEEQGSKNTSVKNN
ncbi:OstA-like protein [Olivibacter sitiensis]|uniref:OstA-like protein n=1 Tax=Olivibacter sitiensis TaxID=376470 RepID=UPI00041754FA|nr:OstA-like protein [Olivibacter sitiensis]